MRKVTGSAVHIEILKRKIGEGFPVFIVAELSANHLQNFDLTAKTIKAMKESGADAVKFSAETPDALTIDCDNEYFRIKGGTPWDGITLYELYKKTYMPWEWQPKLKKIALDLGLLWFSTPTDKTSVDFLETVDVPAYKIASFEIVDIPFVEYVAGKGKPVILSTGIATLPDIEAAVAACRKAGNDRIAVLKCTSAYPAAFEEVNLRVIPDLKDRFKIVTGISDHTQGIAVPVASVALGAKIIEKHFTLDRKLGGPDAEFSLEPAEFKAMVKTIREAEKALGEVAYELPESVKKNKIFCRSIFAVKDIKRNEKFTEENIRSIRPGNGLPPKELKRVLGKKASKDISRGTPLSLGLISGEKNE